MTQPSFIRFSLFAGVQCFSLSGTINTVGPGLMVHFTQSIPWMDPSWANLSQDALHAADVANDLAMRVASAA